MFVFTAYEMHEHNLKLIVVVIKKNIMFVFYNNIKRLS